ncbi:hypothetical protein [Cycloclasticus pugetii]|uniref:hypothetical protein n=1 Tax=Cycloclasticus pugetii TaxID=34068 RepID=UPI003A94F90D
MGKLTVTLTFLLFSAFASAHSGADPLKELNKNKNQLSSVQSEFEQLNKQSEQFESLEKQERYLQKNILILRRLMAKEYPHVTAGMSKYKLDYMGEIDNSLEEFKQTLQQMKTAIEN